MDRNRFTGEMSYAYQATELNPVENGWMGYLVTQNGWPED